ncbi:hypothetical protein F4809DRAFT_640947 [Biscogniauxia mediterranea]|nr:hypothetical protein F4809DRAFT_640947 [Biscogniauxia mediterranea]
MKYGEQFEEASVPGWSLHNIDYNSLKHQIKTHTTKDQATAIAIPGHQDYALKRFEDAFYIELCNQHNRVDLFVSSKADEIARRLRHLSGLLHQLMVRCTSAGGMSVKRQRRFAKYQWQVDECGRDIQALVRFVNAQIIAFRKILKKYKKWTGSTTLSSRFKENVLGSPKSFTKRDFHPLQLQYQDLVATLDAASPLGTSTPNSLHPEHHGGSSTPRSQLESGSRRPSSTPTAVVDPPVAPETTPHITYWNEYDHGSEAGDYGYDGDGGYAIYIDPDASPDFPGLVYIKTMFAAPVDKVRHWLKKSPHTLFSSSPSSSHPPSSPETQSLLGHGAQTGIGGSSTTPPVDYFSINRQSQHATADNDATEDDETYASSDGFPDHRRGGTARYLAHHYYDEHDAALDSKMARYRDKVLARSVVFAFAAAFVLLLISGMLMATGRHRLRLEVDAGVTVGCVASLFCACMGLGAMLYRSSSSNHHRLVVTPTAHGTTTTAPHGYMYTLAVWAAFVAVCALNGMLLVLVVGSTGL